MKKLCANLILLFAVVVHSFGATVIMKLETAKYIEIMESAIKGEAYVVADDNGDVRWQTVSPYESAMISNSKGVFQFEKQNGKWRKLDSKFNGTIKRVVDEIRRIVVGDFGDSYEIKKTSDTLVLIPKNSSTKNFISKINITLRNGSRVPKTIEFIEVSGDRMVMEIVKFSEDAKLDSIFDETKIGEINCQLK